MLPRERRFGRCGRFAKKLFEDFSFTVRTHHPPLKPLCALALPFIKTRPLVPKKFENPKKPHIAPSQRLVAKVHPSQTSLSKGPLFFPSLKKKVRIRCLCLCATSLEHPPPLHLRLHSSGRCESRSTRRASSRISRTAVAAQAASASDIALAAFASPLLLHSLSLVSFRTHQHPATLILSKQSIVWRQALTYHLCRKS
jgi:hypothetical protein